MKTKKDYTLLAVLLVIFLAVIATSRKRDPIRIFKLNSKQVHNDKHTCTWPECPYHGIRPNDYKYIVEYVGNYGTDAYYLDSLHLVYPTYPYELLEMELDAMKRKK